MKKKWIVMFSVCIAVGVFLARALTSGPAYFADGPAHLAAIAAHTYVIQPPGYWLFTRIGGLFPNPDAGILFMNWCFSALGCLVFYACARRLVRSPLAELGTLLYATAFFAWFSGNVHSTYASQLLFAPLVFYFMLRFSENRRASWLLGVGASFALGAGLRPSDGVFLVPLLIVFSLQLTRKQQVILGASTAILCAAWLIPNEIALHRYIHINTAGQLGEVATGAIIFGKINLYTINNALRFFLPLAVALGPAAYFMFHARDAVSLKLWTWVLPGTAFFLLVYISDPTYLDCLLGGYILLCLRGLDRCKNCRLSVIALSCSILINILFYMEYRPLPLHNNVYIVLQKELGNYSHYAVKHQIEIKHLPWFKPGKS
jgi:hypothetical protein